MNYETARFNMIEQQIRPWNVFNQQCLDHLTQIPREEFVPEKYKSMAFSDIEIPLEHGQTMLFPRIEARILEAVNIQADEVVLEIGTGRGYLTACLAQQAKHVTSVDLYQEFTDFAKAKLAELDIHNIQLETGDASTSYNPAAKFDVIILSSATADIPTFYKNALNVGGRLFVVCGEAPVMQAHLITHLADDVWSDDIIFETELAYLVNAQKQECFKF